ncbi:MAG: M48 family metalloprotease [Rickettsiales bacterium]|nr:M48 family metalloprotease [Rickettsiales bacterium]
MYKLVNFVVIYLLSIINFAIILLPLLFIFVPFVYAGIPIENKSIITIISLIFLFVNGFTFVSIVFDFLFGWSTKHYIKSTTPYLKIKNYDFLTPVIEDIRLQFNKPDVQLMIEKTNTINAYAVGNLRKQYVVLTEGIIYKYLLENKDNNAVFLKKIKCILGHEMSHLINKDYLPGLLITLNERASVLVSNIIIKFFYVFLNVLSYIPVIGWFVSIFLKYLYKMISFTFTFFHKYLLLKIYKFFQLKMSRVNEYRCDKQSAMVNGGSFMSVTLEALGEGGYTTIFSTHPKTSDRVKRVLNIKQTGDIIRPDGTNAFVNFLTVLCVLAIPFLVVKYIDLKGLNENYETILRLFINKYYDIKTKISNILALKWIKK